MHSRGLDLRKFVAPEIIFGVGSLDLAGQYGRNLGGSKALVVSDPGVLAAGWTQQVVASVESAGLESALFTRVTPNPRCGTSLECLRNSPPQACRRIPAERYWLAPTINSSGLPLRRSAVCPECPSGLAGFRTSLKRIMP
jgi:hypothetical protein